MKNWYIIIIILVCGCTNEKNYFNGEISLFDDFPETEILTGKNIVFDSIYTGDVYIYDSIMGFSSGKYPDYYFSFFNMNTGEHFLNAFKKGQGSNEFGRLSGSQQFEYQKGDVKLWMYEDAVKKAHLLNITQSVMTQETIVDSVIDLRWKSSGSFRPDSFIFMLNDNKVAIKNQAYKEDSESIHYVPPAYQILDVIGKVKIEEIKLYNEPLISKDPAAVWFGNYMHSIDRIKPDKSKIAMGMQMLCQLNILSISTGKLTGFRMKNTPNFKDLVRRQGEDLQGYYLDMCVDDDYIFGFYSGKKYMDYENYYFSKEIHVFDWGGNPVKRLLLDEKGDYLRLDVVHKKLFLKNDLEEVFCYDIKELLYS